MDMLLSALSETIHLSTFFYTAAGVFLGLMVGAIPGLSAPIAIALAVPLTYQMGMISAIGFLIGINKGGYFGGSLSAILLNTPGTAESTMTAVEGYPMSSAGKPVKAVKYALAGSTFGDAFSTLILIVAAAPLASLALHMGPTEICATIIFALTLISLLEANSLAKGLVAASLGMLFSSVGMDPASGMPRLTMDLFQLERGIPVIIVGIGLLALSELIIQTAPAGKNDKYDNRNSCTICIDPDPYENRLSFKEVFIYIKTLFRSSAIGTAIGALPGIGASASSFLAYGAARNASKDPDSFGKGNPEGIVAAESANNAVVGASLIPLLTLGIPGNIASALLIGAFVLHGVTPGPLMFEKHGDVIYGMYLTMIMSNIFLFFIGLYSMRVFIKVLSAPATVILPSIMYICLLGAYMSEQTVFATTLMVTFTIFGFIMRALKFSFVCFIIGFILGPMLELSFQQSYITFGHDPLLILQRPATMAILIFTVIFVIMQYVKGIKLKKQV